MHVLSNGLMKSHAGNVRSLENAHIFSTLTDFHCFHGRIPLQREKYSQFLFSRRCWSGFSHVLLAHPRNSILEFLIWKGQLYYFYMNVRWTQWCSSVQRAKVLAIIDILPSGFLCYLLWVNYNLHTCWLLWCLRVIALEENGFVRKTLKRKCLLYSCMKSKWVNSLVALSCFGCL